jgi:hypothetical protein
MIKFTTNFKKYSLSIFKQNIYKTNCCVRFFLPTEFVVKYDTKKCKRYKQSKFIRWVCFNVHKETETHYKKLLLLFKHFVNF